jgi:hypothetical protein
MMVMISGNQTTAFGLNDATHGETVKTLGIIHCSEAMAMGLS